MQCFLFFTYKVTPSLFWYDKQKIIREQKHKRRKLHYILQIWHKFSIFRKQMSQFKFIWIHFILYKTFYIRRPSSQKLERYFISNINLWINTIRKFLMSYLEKPSCSLFMVKRFLCIFIPQIWVIEILLNPKHYLMLPIKQKKKKQIF